MQSRQLDLWLLVALILAVVGITGCGSDDGITLTGGDGELKINLNSQQDGIWVNGTGKVMATPDVAILRLGIEVQRETVAAAQAEAQEAMDRVMEALKDEGVYEKDIQTQYFNIHKVTRWDKVYEDNDEQEIVIGYKVTNVVTAKIRDVETAGDVIDAVAIAGDDLTRIDNISFTVDDPKPYYEQAREQAVEYAEEKAKQLAEVAGVKLGKPTYISESTYMPSPNYYGRDAVMAEAAPAPSTSISPGEMEITTNVQMAYSIAD